MATTAATRPQRTLYPYILTEQSKNYSKVRLLFCVKSFQLTMDIRLVFVCKTVDVADSNIDLLHSVVTPGRQVISLPQHWGASLSSPRTLTRLE